MRTNIVIDDDLMAKAMQAGQYTTKKDAEEAGLKLLTRQAAYREILKLRGKLKWEGDESIDWTQVVDAPSQKDVAVSAKKAAQATHSERARVASHAGGTPAYG